MTLLKKRVAIIGTGISGLGCAYQLSKTPNLEVTIFEKDSHIGGHSNTIDFSYSNSNSKTYGIDTGFLVFNRRTYPRLLRLFEELNVPIAKSEMSFSVSMPTHQNTQIEWAGTNLNTIFAQRKNLFKPSFWRMLGDIIRFNRLAKKLVHSPSHDEFQPEQQQSVAEFLDTHKLGDQFRYWYLFPMIGAIWSCPVSEMMRFPIHTLVHFCENHGLLNIINRPQWLTVQGGSREYVRRLLQAFTKNGGRLIHQGVKTVHRASYPNTLITIKTNQDETFEFDEVVFACHSDQVIEILQAPSSEERELLSCVPYQKNVVYVHTDQSLLPSNPLTWAAWNYSTTQVGQDGKDLSAQVCVHYLINKLQPLPEDLKNTPVIVSLNPHKLPNPSLTQRQIEYHHPLFDSAAIAAQKRLPLIQGNLNTWFCGAWTGYGFHEDGLRSGELVAEDILERLQTPQTIQSDKLAI